MPISEVFNEDCMEGMKRYPDKFFDLAIVDPPYGIGEDGGAQRTRGSKKTNGLKKHWDKFPPSGRYFTELRRVSKEQVIWGANHFISRVTMGRMTDSPCWIIWDKLDDGSDFADAELAYTSFDSAVKIYRQTRQSNQNKPSHPRIHPTQKPVKLYKWILENYAKPGDKILDTHMGSQSSRIAAFNMGFDYYGWEIDKEYFDKGNKRFKEQTAQMKIF